MNYKEYLSFREEIIKKHSYKDFGELNLYKTIPGPVLNGHSLGHNNGNVHRCHLAEDFCRVMNIHYHSRDNMAISYGVRDFLNEIMSCYKNKKWIIPGDVYPFYQETAKKYKIQYEEYFTLNNDTIDIIDKDGDILLLCFPLKPSGRIITIQEIEKINKWKEEKKERIVIVDCAYCNIITPHISLMQSYDFTLLFSLSKILSHPNIMGLGILSRNILDIRNIFINRKMDKLKMHQAYNLLNHEQDFKERMIDILNEKLDKLRAYNFNIFNLNEKNIPGYLYYSPLSFDYYLNYGILTIPASVYNGKTGSIFSTLNGV